MAITAQLDTDPVTDPLAGTWMISSDSHIIEPPDLWTATDDDDQRLPRVVAEETGDWWYVDGRRTMSFVGLQPGGRFERSPRELKTSGRFADVDRAAYEPAAYLRDNERDGVWGSVIYPSEGLAIYAIPNSELVSKAMRIYNDWIADFCSHDPARLKAVAMINVDDPAEGAAELTRARDLGLVGGMITVSPPAWQPYRSSAYDVLWATAADLDMPLGMHVATDRADPRSDEYKWNVVEVPPSVFVNKDYHVRQSLGDIIFSGVFEQYPGLRVGSVEQDLGWIAFFLEQMDYTYTNRPPRGDWHRYADPGVLPSDYFRSNSFASFQEDRVGITTIDTIGAASLVWGSDYPHTQTTFPRSKPILRDVLAGLDDGDVLRIVRDNALPLYGFDPPPAWQG